MIYINASQRFVEGRQVVWVTSPVASKRSTGMVEKANYLLQRILNRLNQEPRGPNLQGMGGTKPYDCGNRTQRQTYGEISKRMDIAVRETFNKSPRESLAIMHKWLRPAFLDLSKYQLPTICTEEAETARHPNIEPKSAGTVVLTDLKRFVLSDLRNGEVVQVLVTLTNAVQKKMDFEFREPRLSNPIPKNAVCQFDNVTHVNRSHRKPEL